MRKEAGLITLFTCAAGAIGLFIRWVQVSSIFEPETGLAVRGAPSSFALVATIAVYAAALIVVIRTMTGSEKPEDYRTAMRGRSIFYPLAAAVLGIASIVAGVLMFAGASGELRPMLWRVLALAAVLCGASYPVLAMGPSAKSSGALTCLAALMPPVFFCVWLVVSYMMNSANPVLWEYAIETLAIAGAVLGYYYCAGYAFGKPRPLSTAYFSQLGAFLCIVTLADTHSTPALILFACAAVMLLLISSVQMGNFKKPVKKPING